MRAASLKAALLSSLDELAAIPIPKLLDLRYEKFRAMGKVTQLIFGALPATVGVQRILTGKVGCPSATALCC